MKPIPNRHQQGYYATSLALVVVTVLILTSLPLSTLLNQTTAGIRQEAHRQNVMAHNIAIDAYAHALLRTKITQDFVLIPQQLLNRGPQPAPIFDDGTGVGTTSPYGIWGDKAASGLNPFTKEEWKALIETQGTLTPVIIDSGPRTFGDARDQRAYDQMRAELRATAVTIQYDIKFNSVKPIAMMGLADDPGLVDSG
jgi:hypothetical protein